MDKNSVASLRCAHVGKILSNFAILGTVLCISSVVYALLVAVYYTVLIMILLITLFTILYYYPNFKDYLQTETIQVVYEMFKSYLPYIAPVTVAVSAVSVIMLAVSKQKSGIPRLVLASVALAVSLATTVVVYLGGAA